MSSQHPINLKRPASHSRLGCATCRKRKVRCDETREVCGHCSRLNLSCEWYDGSNLPQRSRVNKACERCRRKKIKCTSNSDSGQGSCDPCQLAQTNCGNDSQKESARVIYTPTTSSQIELPDKQELRRLVKAYFDGPHFFCFYAFIHRPTLEQMLDEGLVPDSLLLIVIATGLRFQEPHNPRPDQWADSSRLLAMKEIFCPPSMATLQTLLLLQRYEWHRAAHVNAWFLSGLAIRLAHGLQLNLEISDDARLPVIPRELRRRLLWSCFVMESMIEAGRTPLSGLDVSSIEVKLPCDERSFQLGIETDMPTLDSLLDINTIGNLTPQSRPGISAFLVQLAGLRRDILRYTLSYHPRNKERIPQTQPWDTGSLFMEYEAQLSQWDRNLPEELRFTTDAIYRRRPQLVSFMTLHCLFHGCYCDLYWIGSLIVSCQQLRRSTPPPTQAEPFLANCRRGRLQHALEICNVISEILNHQPSGHDPMVAMCISLAIRVLSVERHPDDSAALGLTDEIVHTKLDAAVKCAKDIVPRSVPIRQLFRSSCHLAKQHGYDIDTSDIANVPGTPQQQTRPPSPSLRTYGTFGSIQSSLAKRKDAFAPAVSSSAESPSQSSKRNKTHAQDTDRKQAPGNVASNVDSDAGLHFAPWGADSDFFSAPNDQWMYGWGDEMSTFLTNPGQIDWVSGYNLGVDFSNSGFLYNA